MKWSILISTVTNVALGPLELLKVRAQLLQEGRTVHGGNLERGAPTIKMFNEIIEAGHGVRGMWKG